MVKETGVRIACSDPDELMRRSRISPITVDQRGTILPTGEWRHVQEDELYQIIARPYTPPPLTVRFVDVPKLLGERLWEVQELYDKYHKDRPEASYDLEVEGHEATFEPIIHTLGDRLSTSVSKTGNFGGLHLDRWPKEPENFLPEDQTKLIINLGPSPRYAGIIYNTNASVIASHYDNEGGMPSEDQVRSYARKHVDRLRVLRVRLDAPGNLEDEERYYAGYESPLRNPVHDGLNPGEGESSIGFLVFKRAVKIFPASF